VARNAPVFRIALSVAALVLVLVPAALADKGGNGGGKGSGSSGGNGSTAPSTTSSTSSPSGGSSGCTQNPSRASITNTWSWSGLGSFGMPGQQLTYAILVDNYDVGCGSSSFVVSMSAPTGFAVSIPTNSITLASGSTGYIWAYVTSPNPIADGDNPLTVTVKRAGSSSWDGSNTSYYKVYSTDAIAPTLYYPSPDNGAAIKGRSYNVSVGAYDDHLVRKIEVYIDGVYKTTTSCDGIANDCQLSYKWSIGKVKGLHSVTFKASDWMGNVGVQASTVTVN
jgi:Bacterial Ig domain